MAVMLKDKNRQVPNGFRYLIPETGWDSTVVLPKFPSLRVLTDAVIQHRKGNMHMTNKHGWSLDPFVVENQIAQYNAEICRSMGWDSFITGDASTPPRAIQAPAQKKSAPVVVVRKTAAAVSMIRDWLGSNLEPVSKDLATKRAWVCGVRENGEGCQFNSAGGMLEKIGAIAGQQLKVLVAVKKDMNLATEFDSSLKSCTVCSCFLPVKVFVPLQHILDNTTPEEMERFDNRCWIKNRDA